MVKAIAAAQAAARKAIESTYAGTCTIIEHQEKTDAESHITDFEDVTVVLNQPCKLSFEKINTVVQTETAANISQAVKLFLAPEVKVNGGSKIIVEQDGMKNEYSASGEPAIYKSHQEIILELFRGWA